MAKKTTLKLWTGEIWEDLFPSTHADLIIMGDGQNNLQHLMNEVVNKYNGTYEAAQEALRQVEQVEQIAKGAQQAVSFTDYNELISVLNSSSKDAYKIGQSIYIIRVDVPDLWVSYVDDNTYEYTYTTDEDFVNELKNKGYVIIGHYALCQLETGKVMLEDYLPLTGGTMTGSIVYDGQEGRTVLEERGLRIYSNQDEASIDIGNKSDNLTITPGYVKHNEAKINFPDSSGTIALLEDLNAHLDSKLDKLSIKTDYDSVYAKTATGDKQILYPIMFPHYTSHMDTRTGIVYMTAGQILCNYPDHEFHAANKGYADNKLTAAKAYADSLNKPTEVYTLNNGGTYELPKGRTALVLSGGSITIKTTYADNSTATTAIGSNPALVGLDKAGKWVFILAVQQSFGLPDVLAEERQNIKKIEITTSGGKNNIYLL